MLAARSLWQPQRWAAQLAHKAGLARARAVCRPASYVANPMVQPEPLPAWATVDPYKVGISSPPGQGANLVSGEWKSTRLTEEIPDPLTGEPMFLVPDTSRGEAMSFASNLLAVPRTGLHNPLKNPERYGMLGDVSARAAAEMLKPEVQAYFTALIQRVVGKSAPQCQGEVTTVMKFLENFSGDNVRQLARGFSVPGDHAGQQSCGYRFPFGGVSLITPFNFPLEIPAIQLMSALYMGNRPLVKVDSKVQPVCEQFVRMLQHAGLPLDDLDFIYSDGPVMNDVIVRGHSRMCLFTGSQAVAEKLVKDLHGRVKLEDAGFDWKILGPDVPPAGSKNYEFAVWQADQDAYGFSGQKCSAQSILFVHKNWAERGFVEHIKERASRRNLKDMTIGPVLSWTTEAMLKQVSDCLEAHPSGKVLWGAKPLEDHLIPERYGALEPTAVSFSMEALEDPTVFAVATREVFGPFQVIVEYGHDDDGGIDAVIRTVNRLQNHLTAGVVSNDNQFIQHVLESTINGTTYAGWRARTTGAPQQMWFGPSGDPLAAGIHTKEAIQLVWSGHREIFTDTAFVADSWEPVMT